MAVAMRAVSIRFASSAASSSKAKAPRRSAARASWLPGEGKATWLPGGDTPAYLDGSLPGDYGYDPLGLGETPEALERFSEAEVIHGRWAMLGVTGIVAVEALGQGTWTEAPMWMVNGGSASYLGNSIPFDTPTILAAEIALMGFSEGYRMKSSPEERKYPGGSFDPLNLSEGDLDSLKEKEIVHGRLAMLATIGCFAQTGATGQSPLSCLAAHVADPWAANVGNAYVMGPPGL